MLFFKTGFGHGNFPDNCTSPWNVPQTLLENRAAQDSSVGSLYANTSDVLYATICLPTPYSSPFLDSARDFRRFFRAKVSPRLFECMCTSRACTPHAASTYPCMTCIPLLLPAPMRPVLLFDWRVQHLLFTGCDCASFLHVTCAMCSAELCQITETPQPCSYLNYTPGAESLHGWSRPMMFEFSCGWFASSFVLNVCFSL
jgi:hypothetical protein